MSAFTNIDNQQAKPLINMSTGVCFRVSSVFQSGGGGGYYFLE